MAKGSKSKEQEKCDVTETSTTVRLRGVSTMDTTHVEVDLDTSEAEPTEDVPLNRGRDTSETPITQHAAPAADEQVGNVETKAEEAETET